MLHKTRDGEIIPLVTLEDIHLMNIIAHYFRAYSVVVNEENKELNSFIIGKEVKNKVMTPEIFNDIMKSIYPYVIEAFRRDKTKEAVIETLAKFNPVFKSREKIIFNSASLLSSNNHDHSLFEGEDRYSHGNLNN